MSENRPDQKKLASGFAFSIFIHLCVLLILSIMVVGSNVHPSVLTLWTTASNDPLDDTLVVNEFVPSMESDVLDSEANSHSFGLNVESVPKIEFPVSATATATSDSGPLHAGDLLTTPSDLSRTQAMAIASIQSRVQEAGGKRGEVQFALAWKNVNDVDLHVITPSGEHISHQHKRSHCSGELDVDMNINGESDEPVENIRWISRAPWGRYTVLVNLYKIHVDGMSRPSFQSPYQLLAKLGKETEIRKGVAGPGRHQVSVWRFHYVSESVSEVERTRLLLKLEQLQEREEALAGEMLVEAKELGNEQRERKLNSIVLKYPHTDAAIEALQLMTNKVLKR